MKRGWWMLLLLSVGLNLGLGYTVIGRQDRPVTTEQPLFGPPGHRPGDGHRWAQADTVAWGRWAEKRLDRLAERLALDPTQRRGFQAVGRKSMPAIAQGRDRVHSARRHLHTALGQPELDPVKVHGHLRELMTAQAALDSTVTETLLAQLSMLVPDQRLRFLQMMPWPHYPPRPGPRSGPNRMGGGDPGKGNRGH